MKLLCKSFLCPEHRDFKTTSARGGSGETIKKDEKVLTKTLRVMTFRKTESHRSAEKTFFRAMKLTAILLLGISLQVSAVAVSQKITYSGKEVALEEVFKAIEQQTGFGVFYNAKLVRGAGTVSIEANQMDLEEFLDSVLKGQQLIYSLKKNTIIVGRKTVSPNESTGPQPVLDIPPIKISGVVTGPGGQRLSGATIQVKNKSITITADEEGRFELDIDAGSILVISYIGFETREIKVNAEKTLNIEMRVLEKRLDTAEVVINTGFQKMKPNEVTGSVTYISEEKLDQRIAPGILSRLDGITNGLIFNKTPGGATEIRIRGESTIFGKTSPLIVVDNFPFDGNISAIDPNNIESISVLKDAAAASIWGVQAGNGVIVITTKKGRMNQPVKVELNANVIVGERPDLHYGNKITPEQYIDFERNLFATGYYDFWFSDPNLPAISPVAEILNKEKNGEISSQDASQQIERLSQNNVLGQMEKYLYRSPVYQQYQVNVSSGGPRSSYFFSAGYDDDKTLIRGNSFRRINLSSNYSFRPIKNLELSNAIYYHNTHTNNNVGLAVIDGSNPYTEFIDENGNEVALPRKRKEFEDTISTHGFLDWHYYPLSDQKYREGIAKNNDIRILSGLNYEVLKGVSIDLKYQYQFTDNTGSLYTGPETYQIRDRYNTFAIVNEGQFTGSNYNGGLLNRGTFFRQQTATTGHNGRAAVQVNKKFGLHSIIGIAGFEFREVKTSNSSSMLLGYDKNNGSFASPDLYTFHPTYPSGMFEQIASPGSGFSNGGTLSRFRSYFANLSWSFMDKYSLSASARTDGANYFGVSTNLRTVPLWSAGAKWDISKEKFFRSSFVENLSLGATVGYNGNLDQSLASVITMQYDMLPDFITGLPYATVISYPNPELRWEKTLHSNVRTDFVFAKNALYGSFEFYQKKGVDLIGFAFLDPTTGIRTMKGNFSEMKTKGVDIQLSSDILRRKLKWSATLIYNYTSDEITKYDPGNTPPDQYLGSFEEIVPIEGKPLRSVFAYRWAGLDAAGNPGIYLGDTINSNPGDVPKIEDLRFVGRYNPPVFGSLRNTFAWNNFSLAVNITYKFNHYFRRNSINYPSMVANGWMVNGGADYAMRWQKPGDEGSTNIPAFVFPFTGLESRYSQSDILIEKSDHIRLQFVSLGYQLAGRTLRKAGIENLRFTFTADNLGILWRANDRGLDPDQPYAPFLTPKSYAFGITANF